MAANPPDTFTVEEFARLATTDERHELIDGEIIRMPPPDAAHYDLHWRLVELIRPFAAGGAVRTEMAFRPGRHVRRVRIADVAWASARTWAAREAEVYLPRAPELLIEILSDSNTPAEMMRRQDDAFAGGTLEFWAVEMQTRTIVVSYPDGTARTYRSGQEIPLTLLGGGSLAVDVVFRRDTE